EKKNLRRSKTMSTEAELFDSEHNVHRYTLVNSKQNFIVKVIDFGATITNIFVRDKQDVWRDVVLGFDRFDDYLREYNPYFGATVGRFANRIARSSFVLNGHDYKLETNEKGKNTLHGGYEGFSRKKWSLVDSSSSSLTLHLISANGDQQFPATVSVTVSFAVNDQCELSIDYNAYLSNFEREKLRTFINLTNHSYFNLNACMNAENDSVLNHEIHFTVDKFLENDGDQIPTTEILNVSDIPYMDFTGNSHSLGAKITVKGSGFDDCYVINAESDSYSIEGGKELKFIAKVRSPSTGITLDYFTTEPGFQFYTTNSIEANKVFTKNTQSGNIKRPLRKYCGFCLESQRFPNSCNVDRWQKQCLLTDGEEYKQSTVYRFSIS
ncbi:hypothetical protein B4U79_00738, partial [Dinothrombium tinctorium]